MTRPLVALAFVLAGAAACSKSSSPAPTPGSGSQAAAPPAPAMRKPMQRPVRPPGALPDEGGAGGSDDAGDRRQMFRDRIAAYDTNGDGQLSPEERHAMRADRTIAIVQKLDSDTDGKLSPTEVLGSPIERRLGGFAGADTDRDGFLTGAEVEAALAASALKHSGFDHWAGSGSGSGAARRAPGAAPITSSPADDGRE